MKRAAPVPAGPPIAAGYVRVSRDKRKHDKSRTEEIVSPDTQRTWFQNYAEMRGWTMPEEFIVEDLDYSGFRIHYSKRPGLMELLEAAKQGRFQHLLVYKFNRLGRRQREFLELLEIFAQYGVGVVSVTESVDTSTPGGRMVIGILSSFAQYQSEELSEYIANSKSTLAAQGIMPGTRSPYGLIRSKGAVEKDPVAFPFLLGMFEHAAAGATMYGIRKWLEEQGARPPAGRHWWDDQVKRILRNPVYIGKFLYGGRVIDGRHEAVIPSDLYYRVQQLLDERKAVHPERRHRLLSGIIACGKCGAMYNVDVSGAPNRRLGYRCARQLRDGCDAPRLDALSLERVVSTRLQALMANPSVLDEREKQLVRAPAKQQRVLSGRRAKLERELDQYREMTDTLFEDYHRRHIITPEQFADKNRQYLDAMQAIEAELAFTVTRLTNPDADRQAFRSAREALRSLGETWVSLSDGERAGILRQIGLRLVVKDGRVEMRLLGIAEDIPAEESKASLWFGRDQLQYGGRAWSQAQTEYLLEHWATDSAPQIAAAVGRKVGSVHDKVTLLRNQGLLPPVNS